MDFVKSFDLLGKEAKQIACIEIAGAPATSTIGAVGVLGMDTKTGDLYKCTAVSSGTYTWVKIISGVDVDAKIAAAQLGGGEVDLSDYAKKTDLEDYATQKYVDDEIAKIPTGDVDLTDYAKKTDIPSLDGYALKTDIPNLEAYALKTDIPSLDGYAKTTDIPSLTDYATKVYVDEAIRVAIQNLIEQYLSGDTPGGDQPTTTTVTIEGDSYSVPIGSTWQYLLDNKSDTFKKSDNYIKNINNGRHVWYKNGAQVKSGDTIIAGSDQYVYVGGNQSATTYITFTVGDDIHKVSTGTTWAVWADNGSPYNLYDDDGRISLVAQGGEPYIVDSVEEDYVAIAAGIKNNGEYFIGTLEDIGGGGDSGDTEEKQVTLNNNVIAEYPGDNVYWGNFLDGLSDFRGEQLPGDSTGHTYVYYDGTYGEGYLKDGNDYVSMGDYVKAQNYTLSN